jgi:hypothetical protein
LAALALGVPWNLPGFWISMGLAVAAFGPWEKGGLRASCLLAALFFSLGPVDRSIYFTLDRSFYDTKPALAGKMERPGRLYQWPEWVDSYRVISGRGVGAAYAKLKDALVPNWPLAFGLEEDCRSSSLFLMPFLRWYYLPDQAGKAASRKILDYLGSRYVMGCPADRLPPGGDREFWANRGAFPPWFSVRRALPGGTWQEDRDRFLDPRFDFGKTCLIAEPDLAGPYGKRQVSKTDEGSNGFGLETSQGGRCLLVSSELAYPGWRAVVGGRLRPLQRINHDFRGLILEKGEREAQVLYRPDTFRLGCFLSLLATALWVWLALRLFSGLDSDKSPFEG